jgi:hypothetical protein
MRRSTLQRLERQIGRAVSFPTRADALTSSISSSTDILFVSGYSTAGDLGKANYKRAASEPAHAGKFQSADGTWWELAEATVTPEMFGAVGDGATNDTTALNNADAFDAPVRLQRGKTYLATGQLTLGQTHWKKKWFTEGGRGAAVIKSSHDSGSCILVGPDSATAVRDITFENIMFDQDNASDQTMIEIRSVRGCRFQNCWFENIYFGMKLGTATRSTYITEVWDCEVHMRLAGHSTWMKTINTFGQIDLVNSFVEGNHSANSIGLDIGENVQSHVDHLIFRGGYFSRFDRNIYVNSRVGNWEMGAMLHMEGWTTANIYLDANASWENVTFTGITFAGPNTGGLYCIFANVTQTANNMDGFVISGCTFGIVTNQPAIEMSGNATQNIQNLLISGCAFRGCVDSTDNTHAVIDLNRVGSAQINNLIGRNVNGAKRYSHMVRSVNSGASVKVGADIFLENPGTAQSSVT